jgi:RNA polymerase sigma-70 factor (ECF subfamily)
VSRAGVPVAEEIAIRAWVFRIARNLALNHLRDDRRRPQTIEMHERAAPPTQELGAAIGEALGALDALDRDVFLLRESAGLSYDDIAATCGITIEAVRSRLRRTRERLRQQLGGVIAAQRTVRLRRPSGDK